MLDTYEKRDRLSHYKKMTIRADNSSIDETQNNSRFGGGSPIHKDSSINNLKLSKAGIPLGPNKN